jgi:hypothetical protein
VTTHPLPRPRCLPACVRVAILRLLLAGLPVATLAVMLLAPPADAQRMPPARSYFERPRDYVPESDRHPDWYTVDGEARRPEHVPPHPPSGGRVRGR